jgi:glycosyltransferase involved in cell wall biosynthesis
LITPGHISSNPRLVKEAICLSNNGYHVHLIFVQNLSFLVKHDEHILNNNPTWSYDILNKTDKKHELSYLLSTIRNKLALLAFKYNLFARYFNLALNKNFYQQLKKAIDYKADLYIAHNLGALPIAVNAAKNNSAKCAFDAEDFHRQEVTNDINSIQYNLVKFIEDKYLTQVDYITCASKLIAKNYHFIYNWLNPLVINNVFSKDFLQNLNPSVANSPLKLFWFSQTIGKGRGLEDVIFAINKLKDKEIELHLLGNISIEAQNYFNKLINFKIDYIAPIVGDDIFKLANNFDIGLALEPAFCLNNNIALSNKLFTYLQAGLAVVASETAAQKKFSQENRNIGESYPIGNVADLAQIINTYYHNRDLLNTTKQNALKLAETTYNWELESKKFINIIEETLKT